MRCLRVFLLGCWPWAPTLLVLQHQVHLLCWGARHQHLENNTCICSSKLNEPKMWVTQTLDIHSTFLNFKCAPWHNFSPCNLSPKQCLRIFFLPKFNLQALKQSGLVIGAHWSSSTDCFMEFRPEGQPDFPHPAGTVLNYEVSGRWCQEGAVPSTTGMSCQSHCCLVY